MSTNLAMDPELLQKTLKISGLKTKKDPVIWL
jgi:Arc/MetJ family transcription regulator